MRASVGRLVAMPFGALLCSLGLGLVGAACSGDEEPSSVEAQSIDDTADGSVDDPPDGDAVDGGGTDEDADGVTADEGAGSSSAVVEAGDGDGGDDGEGDGRGEDDAPAGVVIDDLEGEELEEFLARRYEAFWAAFGEAREHPEADPASAFPALGDLATGEQLDAALAELRDMAETGRALRQPAERAIPGLDLEASHRIRIEQVDEGSAELVVCHVNDRESIEVASGAVISDLVVTVKAEATMVRADDTWKLVRSTAVALDPGVGGCWLEDESLYPW